MRSVMDKTPINLSPSKKPNQVISFTENFEKQREEEESNLLTKTLTKRKGKDYQQEKVGNKINKNFNLKLMSKFSSNNDFNAKDNPPMTSSNISRNKNLILQKLMNTESNSSTQKQPPLSLRNMLRSKNRLEPAVSQFTFEETTPKRKISFGVNNFLSSDKRQSNIGRISSLMVNTLDNDHTTQSATKSGNSLKDTNFVKQASKSKGFRQTLFKNTINNMIDQVVKFEEEKQKFFDKKSEDEEENEIYDYVKKKKEKKVQPKIEKGIKSININKFVAKKFEEGDKIINALGTIKKNELLSTVKREKSFFNYNNLDALTKQIKEFKQFSSEKQNQILASEMGDSQPKRKQEVHFKSSSKFENNVLERLIQKNDKSGKRKHYEFFNQKKFVLMNYNGVSLYCPVIKKENISKAMSRNEIYDLIFQ